MKPELPPKDDAAAQDDAVIGVALRRSVLVFGLVVLVLGGGLLIRSLTRAEPEEVTYDPVKTQTRRVDVDLPQVPLVEITDAAGVDFVHHNGAAGEKLLPETMGSGVAFFDYDNDGDQDLFFVNSADWPFATAPADPARCRLYANDGAGRFRDVTVEVGIDVSLYGMGVAVGDIDNDGWRDLYLTAVGENRLLKNQSGVFKDITETAGVAGAASDWGTSCGFFDYDNDGLLDLFVCNYVTWSRETDVKQNFTLTGVGRAYGPPRAFAGAFPTLYHNEGDGTFTDVSAVSGVQIENPDTGVPVPKALGLAPVDVNDDGWLDIVVANDTVQNLLLINQQDGTFAETAALSGIAYDRNGTARGAMGIDTATFRSDGTLAVGIGNFANEMSALYMAKPGQSHFFDAAIATGLGPPTRLGLTFGFFFFDVDLDGRIDVLGANGHLEEEINQVQQSQHYEQPPQLFWNAGRDASSELVQLSAKQTGDDFVTPLVGRGAAYGDIDGDGDLDIVITANNAAPRLFRNEQTLNHHYVRVKLVGTESNRDAIGATIQLKAGDLTLERLVMPTKSYLSQCELPVTLGLGDRATVDELRVTWPNGDIQTLVDVPIDTFFEIRQSE